jgi:thioesterase domain-containing protein/acyl carrier protein
LEKRLATVWQELLGIDKIGLHDNYFDLGGDSYQAVRLFAKIESVFKIKLPLSTLFESPTIGKLAQTIYHEAPASRWSPLVTIQGAGTRPVFFCAHAAGGGVLIYRDLSRYLGADQPFYGLQAPGQDGSCSPLARIEDMAALYVKEIQRVQPHGPYFLGGYCMGGTIAYEMAQQLQAKGEKVALLALFDTVNWCKVTRRSKWSRVYHALERVMFHAANLLSLDSEGMGKFLRHKGKDLRSRIPVWRGMLLARFNMQSLTAGSETRTLGQIWQGNDRAALNYVAKPYPGTVTDFRPKKQYWRFSEPNVKWHQLAGGGQEVVVLPVYPAGMLAEPFVKHLADALRKSIDSAIHRCVD